VRSCAIYYNSTNKATVLYAVYSSFVIIRSLFGSSVCSLWVCAAVNYPVHEFEKMYLKSVGGTTLFKFILSFENTLGFENTSVSHTDIGKGRLPGSRALLCCRV